MDWLTNEQLEEYTFKKSAVFRHPQRVYNVIPGDFTQDGRLDLLVLSQAASASQLAVQLYRAQSGGKFGMSCVIPTTLTHH